MGTVHNHPTKTNADKLGTLIARQGYFSVKLANAQEAHALGIVSASEVERCKSDLVAVDALIRQHMLRA